MATSRKWKPPPELEGKLWIHRTRRFPFGRNRGECFCVVLKDQLFCHNSREEYYNGEDQIFKISLDQVGGIIDCPIPSTKDWVFKIVFTDCREQEFSAVNKEDMERWVVNLLRAKEYWAHQKEQPACGQPITPQGSGVIIAPDQKGQKVSVGSVKPLDSLAQDIPLVLVKKFDGNVQEVLLPPVFKARELFASLNLKTQRSSKELWAVVGGTESKLEEDMETEFSYLDCPFFLLNCDYKLLVVHFEDRSFEVLPVPVDITASEVPFLPLFAKKLKALKSSNAGLFLVSESGTAADVPFRSDEEPLLWFWEKRNGLWSRRSHQRGTFLLRDKALKELPISSSPTREQILRDKKQNDELPRTYNNALRNAEFTICARRYPSFENRGTRQDLTGDQSPLLLREDHFSDTVRAGSQATAGKPSGDVRTQNSTACSVCSSLEQPHVCATPNTGKRRGMTDPSGSDGVPISKESGSFPSRAVPFGNQEHSSGAEAAVLHVTGLEPISTGTSPEDDETSSGNHMLESEGSGSTLGSNTGSTRPKATLKDGAILLRSQERSTEGNVPTSGMHSGSSPLKSPFDLSCGNQGLEPDSEASLYVGSVSTPSEVVDANSPTGHTDEMHNSKPDAPPVEDLEVSLGNREKGESEDVERILGDSNATMSGTAGELDDSRPSCGDSGVASGNQNVSEGKETIFARPERILSDLSSEDTAVEERALEECPHSASEGVQAAYRTEDHSFSDRADSSLDVAGLVNPSSPHRSCGEDEASTADNFSNRDVGHGTDVSGEEPKRSRDIKIPSTTGEECPEARGITRKPPWNREGGLGPDPDYARNNNVNSTVSALSQAEGVNSYMNSEGVVSTVDCDAQSNGTVRHSDVDFAQPMRQNDSALDSLNTEQRNAEHHTPTFTSSCEDSQGSAVMVTSGDVNSRTNRTDNAETHVMDRLNAELSPPMTGNKIDGGTAVPANSSISDSDKPGTLHNCEYFKVMSPHTMNVVLRACTGSSVEEEEGEVNKLSSICLSGTHLRWNHGSWSIVDKFGIEQEDGADLTSLEGKRFDLERGITAVFLQQEKKWIVLMKGNDNGAGLGGSVAPSDAFLSEASPTFQVSGPHQSSPPSSGQRYLGDERRQPGCTNMNRDPDSKRQLEPCEVVSRVEKDLHDAVDTLVQALEQITETSRNVLDSTRYEDLERTVRQTLCAPLTTLLLSGFRRKGVFKVFSYSFTDVLKESRDISKEVRTIVDHLDALELSSDDKFQFFVCECLNKRKGTLALWLEHVLSGKNLISEYYQQCAYIQHILPETRTKIVCELRRISNLPFKLDFPVRIIQEAKRAETMILVG